jgi:hypothetical protein
MHRSTLSTFALGLSILLAACHTEEKRDPDAPAVCSGEGLGALRVASTCGAQDLSTEKEPVEVFRIHAVEASSAAGAVTRVVSTWLTGVMSCIAESVVGALVSAITASDATTSCRDDYDGQQGRSFVDGVYQVNASQSAGTSKDDVWTSTRSQAEVRLFVAKDMGSLKRGDLVKYDVRSPDTFLVGARATVDATGSVAIAYDRPGPLVEMLGQGATPPNPMVVTESTRESLRSALEIESAVHSNLTDCGYTTKIDQAIERTPLASEVRPKIVSATTSAIGASDPGVVARSWDLSYAPAKDLVLGDAPRGRIDVDLRGPGRLRSGSVVFAGADPLKADLELSCGAP